MGTGLQRAGPAISGNVFALEIVGSTIYVGGTFQNGAGIASADYLLACDLDTGAPRSTVDTDGDFCGPVYALTADSRGALYAGGGFSNLDGIPAADNVAYLERRRWHAMGTGPAPGGGAVDGFVRSLDRERDERLRRHRLRQRRGHPAGRPRREVERLGLERPRARTRAAGRVVPGLDLDQRADDVRLARLRRRVVPERERRSARRLRSP